MSAPDRNLALAELREAGAKVDLIRDGDVAPAIAAGQNTGVDLLMGIGGTPEGAITDSIVMRSRSGTVRRVEAAHRFEKLSPLSGLEYR